MAGALERLQFKSQEKAVSREALFSDYETTRDALKTALGPEIHAVFTDIFSSSSSFAGAKETQSALTEITTDTFILDTLKKTLRMSLPEGPSALISDAARTGEAMLQQKISERVLWLMQQEHLLAADGTVAVIDKGMDSLIEKRLDPMAAAANKKLQDDVKTETSGQILQKALKRTMSRDMVSAAMQTAFLYLREGDNPEVQTALGELIEAMNTPGATLADHDHSVQKKLKALKTKVHDRLFSQSPHGSPVQDNEIYSDVILPDVVKEAAQEAALAVRKNELPDGDARALQRLYDENEKNVDTFARISKGAVAGGLTLLVLTPLLKSCNLLLPPGGTAVPVPTGTKNNHESTPTIISTPKPDTTPTYMTGPGPLTGTETPPQPVIAPYPDQFSLQAMQTLLGQSLDPKDLYANPTYAADAKANIDIVKGWCELSTTCPRNITYETIYLAEATRYSTIAVDAQGNPAAWGSFVNPDGSRSYFEQAFWDARLAGRTTDSIKQDIINGKIVFDLPPLASPGDHWSVVMTPQGGYTILVEVDKNHQPVRWYDAATYTFNSVLGVATETPASTPLDKLVIYPTAENLDSQINVLNINSSALLHPDTDPALVNYLAALGDKVETTPGKKQTPYCGTSGSFVPESDSHPEFIRLGFNNAEIGAITKVIFSDLPSGQNVGINVTLKCAMGNNLDVGASVLNVFFTPEVLAIMKANGQDLMTELTQTIDGTSDQMIALIQLSAGGSNNPLKFTQKAFDASNKIYSFSTVINGKTYNYTTSTINILDQFLRGNIGKPGSVDVKDANPTLRGTILYAWAGAQATPTATTTASK